MAHAQVDPHSIDEEDWPPSLSRDDVWVLDQCIDRSRLGKGVTELVVSMSTTAASLSQPRSA